MTLLNTAKRIHLGSRPAVKVYAGSVKVWPGHRWWRFTLDATQPGYNGFTMAEVQFRTKAGVPLRPTGGTPSALQSYNSDYGPDKACDGDPATMWSSSVSPPAGIWWGYTYPEPQSIVEIAITARGDLNSLYTQTPIKITPQWSDNGVTWVSLPQLVSDYWTHEGQTQVFRNATLASAAVWIDATQDALADGQTIASYTEHSFNHRVFTGSGTLNYRASIDGKPRLDFNGAWGGWLKYLNYTPPASGFTFVMVNRITGPSPSSSIGMPMVYNEDAFNNYEFRFDDGTGRTMMVYEYSSAFSVLASPLVETVGRDYLHWCEWHTVPGGDVRLFVNNTLQNTATYTLAGPSAKTAAIIIGTRGYNGDYPAIMQVGEAAVFDGVLPDADRTTVANYLMDKWSIRPIGNFAATLPAPPPFVNGAPP